MKMKKNTWKNTKKKKMCNNYDDNKIKLIISFLNNIFNYYFFLWEKIN